VKEKQSKKNALVWRITVEEKLSDDLIRLLISPLRARLRKFRDRKDDREEEEERFVQPDTDVQDMSMPPSAAKKWPWTKLQKDQVFLSGEFKAIGRKKPPENFVVNPRRKNFLCIEELIR